jgi:NitT/TauT family transport system ATP-binding protein
MTHLVELEGVSKAFRSADGAPRTILDGVDFTLADGEIVAMLGKSGSGKSTLLRIIAGLVPADGGRVAYRGRPIGGPLAGVAMVFQSFALFPWLTVQQNVELGLEAQGVAPAARRERANAMLDLIGLSGFGGALVTHPDVLLMDEAFSALDVLTGETLRGDILDLWDGKRIPTRGILVVSHNIEEAVMMADRIVIMASDPGRVRHEIRIDLPRPRNADSPEVRALVDDYRLPDADVGRIESVLDLLAGAPFDGRADLPQLSEDTELPDEELFPAYEALGLLGLARVERGDITLTPLGRRYALAGQAQRQALFGRQLLKHVPLAARIQRELEDDADGTLAEEPFLELLEDTLEAGQAKRMLEVAIEWGRYGELYEYDYRTGMLNVPDAQA